MSDIPDAPPKSLISRYLSLSHEKGNSPLLDIAVSENPIIFLFQNDKYSPKEIERRIIYTLQYHSIPIDTNITLVWLGDKYTTKIQFGKEIKSEIKFHEIEEKVRELIDNVQIYFWKTLLIPIQKHFLVPKHTLVPKDKEAELLRKYRVMNKSQLPGIQVTDPMARYLFLKLGDIVHIDRNGTDAYRVCVAPLE